MKKALVLILVLAAAVSLWAGSDSDPKTHMIALGTKAPDFELADPRFGTRFKLSEQKGKVVVLTLGGASVAWCQPCQKLGKALQSKLARDKAKGLAVVDVVMPGALNSDQPEKVLAKAAEKTGAEYPLLVDTDGSVSKAYFGEAESFPALIIISRKGTVLYSRLGYDPKDAAVNKAIGAAIGKALSEKP